MVMKSKIDDVMQDPQHARPVSNIGGPIFEIFSLKKRALLLQGKLLMGRNEKAMKQLILKACWSN